MSGFEDFITENIAPCGARRIGIYNSKGNRVGQAPLGCLTPPDYAKKLYSFGVLSDVHYPSNDSETDFKRALTYFNTESDVEFICICGDLVTDGTAAQFAGYKSIVQSHSTRVPVYAVTGNHDCYANLQSSIEQYTGRPFHYTFERGNDVFIMLGTCGTEESNFLNADALQWLQVTLESNRNKRCFLFFHVLPFETGNLCCGDVTGQYWGDKLKTQTNSLTFKSILRSYPNVIFFHGHSHMRFGLQTLSATLEAPANYDNYYGCHSIHIPSIAIPRDYASSLVTYEAGSEGYVVDVYENGIHLRGRDFVEGEFLPIASYWLDTTT